MSALVILSFVTSLIIAKLWDWDSIEWWFFAGVCAIAFIVIGAQIYDIITGYYFPEKEIYDYIKTLIEAGTYR